jgi:hypothetical protein
LKARKGKVNIVTVTLNRASLEEACESVNQQTYSNWHHYVLGDGLLPTEYHSSKRSTLGFSTVLGAKEPGANMPNGTPNALLRWALKNLDLNDYVCFLDDDNKYESQYLEKMANVLNNNPDIGVVLCGAKDLRYKQNIDGYPELGRCDNSAFMIRSNLAKKIEFPYASMKKNVVQDYEYIRKCCQIYKWVNLPEKLLVFGNGLNKPPNRGQVMFLESWKLPQEAYGKAYNKQYQEALKILLNVISEYKFDAWSIRKVAEIYLILGDKKNAIKYFKLWEKLYKETENHHFAVDYMYSIYLKLIGKEYKGLLRDSIEERTKWQHKEPNALEHLYYLFLSYAFLEDSVKTQEYSDRIIKTKKKDLLWAYEDVAWNVRVFKDIIKVDIFDMRKFLNE